jgi:hypothetical protein
MPSVAWHSLRTPGSPPKAPGTLEPGTIGPRLVGWLLALAVGGAVWLGLSLARGPHNLAGLGVEPRTVLVAVQGTAADPGFAGFLAFINPNSRLLTVSPVSAAWPLSAPGDPLATDAAYVPASALARAVARDAHLHLSGYFIIRVDALSQVLAALAHNVPDWPRGLTPTRTLQTLGWNGSARPDRALATFKAIIAGLPQLENSQNAVQRSVLTQSRTNLSLYQMFMLATYIRGDALRMVRWSPGGRRTP